MDISGEGSLPVEAPSQHQDEAEHTAELSMEDSPVQETFSAVEQQASVEEEHITSQQDQQVQLDAQLDDLAVARELEGNVAQSTPTLNVIQDLPSESQSFVEASLPQDNPEPTVSDNQYQQVQNMPMDATVRRPSAPPEPPKSEYETLSEHLTKDPFDGTAWQALTTLADHSGNLEMIANAYDRLLEVFPNTPSAQIAYLTHFLTPTNFPKAEALFSRFLRPSPSVELWTFYLIYVRRVNPNPTEPAARQTIKKAYEFALNHVGHDKDSGEIWRDYIDFLKSGETSTTWDAQQKMDALRSAYHRAVVVPVENVESIWRELDAFETNLNKITVCSIGIFLRI